MQEGKTHIPIISKHSLFWKTKKSIHYNQAISELLSSCINKFMLCIMLGKEMTKQMMKTGQTASDQNIPYSSGIRLGFPLSTMNTSN